MYQPVSPSSDPVPPSTNRYCLLLNRYHHQPVPLHIDPVPGLHKLCHPTIRDGSTWSKFGARGGHGDVFPVLQLGCARFLRELLESRSQKCWSKTKASVSVSKVLISRNFWSRKKISVSVSKVLDSSLNGDKTLLPFSTFVILVERSKSVMLLPF